jgi:hypothetical protein
MQGIESDITMAKRAFMQAKPYTIVMIGLGISTLLLGLITRMFERTTTDLNNNFESILSSFYLIVVTITTIGYGDIYPVTFLGRITTVFACILGIFINSLFILALNKTIEFTESEDRVYTEITRKREIQSRLRVDAGKIIKSYLILNYLYK